MDQELTLVILAAGMGSRFGGLKQMASMGPNGEFIIDYSIYDAIQAGFHKVVFLIRREHYDLFRESIGSRIEKHIQVEYCFQENDLVPSSYEALKNRTKPLGTAHALLCCRNQVQGPFVMINADDFYGRDAFFQAASFLRKIKQEMPHHYGMISYLIKNTMTEHGAVKRGICEVNDGYLSKIIESSVQKKEGIIVAAPLNGDASFEVSPDDLVSMNMLLFDTSIFPYIEKEFSQFLTSSKGKEEDCEFLIPDVLFQAMKESYAKVEVFTTTSTWYGVTYKEDTDFVKQSIAQLIEKKEYPYHLWNE